MFQISTAVIEFYTESLLTIALSKANINIK